MAASAFFPGSCAITFPRAVLNEHGTRDDLRPKQSAERLPRALLRLFSWPRRRNVPSLSALPACRPPRRNRPKSGASGERPVFRPSPLRAHAPRRALSPFLVQVPFLTQPRSSAAARAQNEAPYKMRRAPRRRQASHECAEHWALNRSRPCSPASRMQIRTGRSSPASALSGATRSAQSRTPESLATRHRPILCRSRAGRSDARSRLPGRVSAQPNKDALFRAAREADRGCIRGSLRELRQLCSTPRPMLRSTAVAPSRALSRPSPHCNTRAF